MSDNQINGNEFLGYTRGAMRGVTIFTASPTGGTTDSLQFTMTFDSQEHCDRVTAVLDEMWQAKMATLRQGYPIR